MDAFTILINLSVLGIVSVVLVLFRKSDNNSKSLEQVKKYTQKKYEEFDLYVEEKMVQLRDLSVSLEVQEKTGKVILDRISGEIDHLTEEIERIEDLNTKVTSYNSTMDKMLNVSKELDERFTQIKSDTSLLDQVERKVRESKKKLNAIEKNISEITNEFIINNNNSINILKEEVFSSTTQMIEDLNSSVKKTSLDIGSVSSLVNDLNKSYENESQERYEKFKGDLNRLLEEHRDNIVRITKEGESLEEASFCEIKNKIEHRSTTLITILEDNLKNIEIENREKINKLSIDMGNIETVANSIKLENKDRLDSIKEQIDSQLLLLKEINSKGVLSLRDEFETSFNEFKDNSFSELEKNREQTSDILNDIASRLNSAKEFKDEAIEKLSSAEEYLGREFLDLKDRVESSVFEITRDLETHEEKIKTAAFNQLESNLKDYKTEIEDKLEDLTSVKSSIDTVKLELTNDIIEVKDQIELELSNIRFSVKEEKDEINKDFDTFKENIKNTTQISQNLLDRDREIIEKSLEEIKLSSNTLKEELLDNEKEIRAQVSLQRDRLIGNIESDLTEKLSAIKDEFDNKIKSLTSFDDEILSARSDLEKNILSIRDELEKEVYSFHDSLTIRMDEEKNELNQFIEVFNGEKVELEREMHNLKEISYNSISEKLNVFEDEYFSKLKEKKELIDIETEMWKSKLIDSVSIIKEESKNSILENMEDVNNKVNTLRDSLISDYQGFKTNFEEKMEQLIFTMQGKESFVLAESEEFKLKVSSEITTLTDQLNSIKGEVLSQSSELNGVLSKISKEQELYISETELFTRTDELKENLERSINTLTNSLNEANEKSSFIQETNSRLNNLRDLVDDINNQIDGLENKKVKIESLENRVVKVLDISDGVDDKLTRIKDSEGQISEIQIKLRELRELEESVSTEFTRLESKESILVETNKAIDSGFGQIQVIENKIDLLKENITPFNNQIDNIKEKLIKVEEKEFSIDQAILTLSNLDNSIKVMEEKIDKMDTAREWIAGVETRLNESVRTADEQVKLMGALAQNKSDSGIKSNSNSAPNMNMRDMVTKLAHNGWKPEDIARTTKLSRGEVELILELSPRK